MSISPCRFVQSAPESRRYLRRFSREGRRDPAKACGGRLHCLRSTSWLLANDLVDARMVFNQARLRRASNECFPRHLFLRDKLRVIKTISKGSVEEEGLHLSSQTARSKGATWFAQGPGFVNPTTSTDNPERRPRYSGVTYKQPCPTKRKDGNAPGNTSVPPVDTPTSSEGELGTLTDRTTGPRLPDPPLRKLDKMHPNSQAHC
ncbi:hypothetical protein DFP72DRAFT_1141684 [Ephemerocybe angulata]|uniref:Uncharacterized protein n=1 Tax=Ephemerocybe angulata TaxID=980116 RepID=A0A8H6HNW0_9AGAR|nr:hypothetical protein DFP72DRAFT_1141684 [Tulosesus angulatus]